VQIDATQTLTVSALFRPERNDMVPLIRLSGRWLAEVVEIGQSVHVVVTCDSITVTPITDTKQTYATGIGELRQATLALRF
jgi:hypothetical protein